ncbi:MAG: cysteine peptidase family C39 domain-containing protein, partial [Bacteroidales bacterium]
MKKIRIRQHHISDCGAACLASAAAWFGLRFPLEQIRQWSGTQTHGISVQGIREGARALHLDAQAYGRSPDAGQAGDEVFRHLPVP